jgi:hypothetical protein
MRKNFMDLTLVLVPIILGVNMSMQWNHTYQKKKSQMRVNFIMNWLQEPVAEINPASQVTWLQSMKFKQLHHFGCWWFWDAGLLCKASQWFSDAYSNVALISYVFSLVITQRLLAGFLSRSDPLHLTLLTSLWVPVVLGTVILRNLRQNFLQHFLAELHFTYDSCRKACCSTVCWTISTHTTITST